jgi:Protein ENHANCED DISEASE RESISTANCE 2, C-terminal
VNGDAEYRNARLKMIPSVVDGPLPIRMVAPPKKETVVNCDYLPISWKLHKEQDIEGGKLHSHLEATLDCMTSRAIRSMASLVKRYLHVLAVDIAVVVAAPDKQSELEPSACLGLWRFDHIDISMCPNLPDRYANEESPDAVRASVALGLSPTDAKMLQAQA